MPAPKPKQPPAKALLDTPQAAEYLSVAPHTLAVWRMKGKGPRYVRLNSVAIRYKITDLDAYIEACAVRVAA